MINMVWKYEKFKGDAAIYAFCPKCGFHHNTSRLVPGTFGTEISYQYNYCPKCGEYLYNDDNNVQVTWNERDIIELYKEEMNNG